MCCVCRTRKAVNELIRIAKIDGKFLIDQQGNANGRGCHVCPSCVEKCIKTRALNRSFKTNVSNDIYDELVKNVAKN